MIGPDAKATVSRRRFFGLLAVAPVAVVAPAAPVHSAGPASAAPRAVTRMRVQRIASGPTAFRITMERPGGDPRVVTLSLGLVDGLLR